MRTAMSKKYVNIDRNTKVRTYFLHSSHTVSYKHTAQYVDKVFWRSYAAESGSTPDRGQQKQYMSFMVQQGKMSR